MFRYRGWELDDNTHILHMWLVCEVTAVIRIPFSFFLFFFLSCDHKLP